MNIFYSQTILENTGILDETESHHCINVLRLHEGDEVYLVDGTGGFFEGVISFADPKACAIDIIKKQYEYGKRNYNIHIAIAPTKNIDRFEWFLEKATEIGVDEITPLVCQRSERKILREDRLEKVIMSAMKQSVKAYRPVLNTLTQFEKFIDFNHDGNNLIAHCMDGVRVELIKMPVESRKFVLLIGPEGDFSGKELQLAESKGFVPVSLGISRLRTETAGIAACQIISDMVAMK